MANDNEPRLHFSLVLFWFWVKVWDGRVISELPRGFLSSLDSSRGRDTASWAGMRVTMITTMNITPGLTS